MAWIYITLARTLDHVYVFAMDQRILEIHARNSAASNVFKDPRYKDVLVQSDIEFDSDIGSAKAQALALTLDRPPKFKGGFVIGRHENADLLLSDRKVSATHCFLAVNKEDGTVQLHERSTRGSMIDGKRHKDMSFDIKGLTQIIIAGAWFSIVIPSRGVYQDQYERNAKQATQEWAGAAVLEEFLPSISAPMDTALPETFGPYRTTSIPLDSWNKIAKRQVVVKERKLFTLTTFEDGTGQREVRAWKKLRQVEHVSSNDMTGLAT